MGMFILRRTGIMLLTALCLTFVVFYLTNLYPNLEKLAKSEGNMRMTDVQVQSWLDKNGYTQNLFIRYGEWLGVVPGFIYKHEDETVTGRCIRFSNTSETAPRFCGILQGDFGFSTTFKENVGPLIVRKLKLTGLLMLWAFLLYVPLALLLGVLAGMREGSKTDRSLSTFAIATSATPEYVSGVILIAVFSSSAFGLKWFKGTSASAMDNPGFANFTLPVLTIALFGIGYITRMTRASMAEVMTAQYIRTARLKGVSFPAIVIKHALRNALIAPFTIIMLQFNYLLTGVVITEILFNYKGFGWTLVQAAGNNDIELLLSCSIVAVFVVLVTQLISDIGYVYLNPRIRVS